MSLTVIDLSRLKPPEVLASLDFAAIREKTIADLQALWPEYDTPLESDPAIKLLEVAALHELLENGRINDAVRSLLLAYARGAMLDHLGAGDGLERLVLQEETATTPEVLESDDDFRRRIQMAPEMLPRAGITAAGYAVRALTAAPEVKDVKALRRGEGRVDLILLGRSFDGQLGPATVSKVNMALDREGVIQLTDVLTVRAARIVRYAPTIRLQIGHGPDAGLVKAEAERAVRTYTDSRHRIGLPVYRRGIEAAAKVGGVEQAISDLADVLPGDDGAAWLESLTVITEILG